MYLKRTISIAKGKGSIGHNSRDFKAENVDATRSHLNTCFVNEDINSAYRKLFDAALENYNAKQKRNDRKIPDYYEKIRTSKQEKLFYEIIVQVGNFEDMSATDENGKLSEEILHRYMADFQKRNPTLYVFSAHLHMDEATPHLHIDFVPYTTGNTRGLETKTTLKGALEKLGFTGGTRSDTELNQWQNAEKEKLAEIMLGHGIEWEKKDTHKEHLTVLDFKKEKRTEEVAKLESKLEELQVDLQTEISSINEVQAKKSKLQAVDKIVAKPTLLDASKVTVDKAEFEEVKTLAKKQVAYEKKDKKLITDNKRLQMENQQLIQENRMQKAELAEYKSVRNQLDIGKIMAENKQLKKFKDMVMKFLDNFNLKEQFNKFINRNEVKRDEKTYL